MTHASAVIKSRRRTAAPGEAGKPGTELVSKIGFRKLSGAESRADTASDSFSPGIAVVP